MGRTVRRLGWFVACVAVAALAAYGLLVRAPSAARGAAGLQPPAQPSPAPAGAASVERALESATKGSSAVAELLGAGSKEGSEDLAPRVQRLLDLADATIQATPSDTFRRPAVRTTGSSPSDLAAWVARETRWAPYRGTLRGAAGVLMDRRGNSLDRSLLLADLLRATGKNVRLARAELGPEAARRLVDSQARAEAPLAPPSSRAAAAAVVAAYAKRRKIEVTDLDPALDQADAEAARVVAAATRTVEQRSSLLLSALGPGRPRDDAPIVTAAADHWWVQVQEAGAWVDFDPAGLAGQPAEPLVPAQTAPPAQLPRDLQHSLDVRVVIEQSTGGRLQEQQVLTYGVAGKDLQGEAFVLRFRPFAAQAVTLSGDAEAQLREAAAAVDGWEPVLALGSGERAGRAFRASGALGTPGAPAGGGPGGLGASGLGGLGGLMGGGESPKPPPSGREADAADGALTAVWLDYTIHVPGRGPRTIRRAVVDLVGPAARAAGQAPASLTDAQRVQRGLALLGDTTILPLASAPSNEFVAWRTARGILDNRPALQMLAAGTAPSEADVARVAGRIKPLPGPLHALALARRAWNPEADKVFIDEINVLSLHRSLAAAADGSLRHEQAVDIVANAVGAWPAQDAFASEVRQGVIDSSAEGLLLSSGCCGGSLAISAVQRLSELLERGGQWVVVRSKAEVDPLDVSPDARARMSESLARGRVIVAAAGPGAREGAWWEVDPSTGETLAIGDRGWGQGMVEVAMKGYVRGMLIGFCLLSASGQKVEAVRYLLYLVCALGGFFTGFGYLIKDSLIGLLADFIGAIGSGAGYFLK